jgi:hypothetical protein
VPGTFLAKRKKSKKRQRKRKTLLKILTRALAVLAAILR